MSCGAEHIFGLNQARQCWVACVQISIISEFAILRNIFLSFATTRFWLESPIWSTHAMICNRAIEWEWNWTLTSLRGKMTKLTRWKSGIFLFLNVRVNTSVQKMVSFPQKVFMVMTQKEILIKDRLARKTTQTDQQRKQIKEYRVENHHRAVLQK